MLEVAGLRVELLSGRPIVEDVSLRLNAGEALGIVGESGSGKTTTGLGLLGYARSGMRITDGVVIIAGENVDLTDKRASRSIRGRLLSYVPQDPATSLNPSMRIGSFLEDVRYAQRTERAELGPVLAALDRVQLPTTRQFTRRFPHQLSGGQQQRVLIASALVSEPPVVVLDEPTTGLDVVTQARVLDEIKRLHLERGLAMVYVSHDLAVISQVVDRIAVMYGGRVVEEGPTASILSRPKHPYTRGLIAASPDHFARYVLKGIPGIAAGPQDRLQGCAFAPRCDQSVPRCNEKVPLLEDLGDGRSVRCIEAERTPPPGRVELILTRQPHSDPILVVDDLRVEHKGHGNTVAVASGISFTVGKSSCVALVGESGSGKTTIARSIAGLHSRSGGTITLVGEMLAPSARDRPRELRRRCQIIFQNPYESLNPRQQVGDQVSRPAQILRGLSRVKAEAEAAELLSRVKLPERLARKFPGELSGGERQRVAIARALAAKPELLICDEITSALDVSVQAAVIELLAELRDELGLALLFVTHNLGIVNAIADNVVILGSGRICEQGAVDTVFTTPQHAHTRELLSSAPILQRFEHAADG